LSSYGYLEGFHYKPRIDFDLLAKYKEGLIATSSCLAGEIPQHIMNDDLDSANAAVEKYVALFGRDHFLMEIQEHGLPEDKKVNPIIAELAEKHGLMLIATNDCHYTDKEDAEAHEVLLAIQTGATMDRKTVSNSRAKSSTSAAPKKCSRSLRLPRAVSNTEKVAKRCNVELNLDNHLIPEFVPPEGLTKEEYIESMVMQGLDERYDKPRLKTISNAQSSNSASSSKWASSTTSSSSGISSIRTPDRRSRRSRPRFRRGKPGRVRTQNHQHRSHALPPPLRTLSES
jgi:DNA polymerase III subunit alpha